MKKLCLSEINYIQSSERSSERNVFSHLVCSSGNQSFISDGFTCTYLSHWGWWKGIHKQSSSCCVVRLRMLRELLTAASNSALGRLPSLDLHRIHFKYISLIDGLDKTDNKFICQYQLPIAIFNGIKIIYQYDSKIACRGRGNCSWIGSRLNDSSRSSKVEHSLPNRFLLICVISNWYRRKSNVYSW